MLKAIHKATGLRVSSFRLARGLEWQGKHKDVFLAPYEEIGNWFEQAQRGISECEVAFIKAHKRKTEQGEVFGVREHFRIKTQGFIENSINESEEHLLAKKHIYNNIEKIRLYNLSNKLVSEVAEIEDVRIERGVGNKRADVLVTFKKWHEVLGIGIAFEVQISPQNQRETGLRSYDRAAHGYSVCWLWSNDIKNFSNVVKVIPYREALKSFTTELVCSEELKIAEIAEKAKRLTNEIQRVIMETVAENEKSVEKQRNVFTESVESLRNESKNILREFNENASVTSEKALKEIDALLTDKLNNAIYQLDLKNLLESLIENKATGLINNSINRCSYCNSTDTHEYMDCYMCFNCKRRTLKNE